MLTRIEFENFRGFLQLTLDGLQRVNLIVGKNNSGKTSLLEGTLKATATSCFLLRCSNIWENTTKCSSSISME